MRGTWDFVGTKVLCRDHGGVWGPWGYVGTLPFRDTVPKTGCTSTGGNVKCGPEAEL